jgi:dephospho-CoA kinase
LALIVFPDPVALKALETITHPHIKNKLDQWVATQKAESVSDALVVIDHPLLIETQDLTTYDAIIVVTCADQVRRQRLITARGLDPGDVEARIAAQIDDDTRRKHATHVIDNSGDEQQLEAAVAALYATLTAASTNGLR